MIRIENFIMMWNNPIHRINSDYGIYPDGSAEAFAGVLIKRDYVFSYYDTIRTKTLSFIGSISNPKASDDNAQTLFKMIMSAH